MPTADFDRYLAEVTSRSDERSLVEDARRRVTLGLQLAELRGAQGMSQTELSVRSGIPQSEISRIEGGRANPTVKTLSALGGALSVELAFASAESR